MKRVLVCALVASIGLGCAARSARYTIPISAAADLATTEIALNQPGVREGNPLFQNRGARFAGKVALSALLIYLAEKAESSGHSKTAKFFATVAPAVNFTAAGWNTYVILDARGGE